MAEPTDMLAREIDEELRRERLLQLWDKYGTYILAVALAVVVGVGGYKFYESRRAQANEAASTRYIIGLRDFAMNKPGEAQKALEDLAANAPAGYAALSRLRLAGYDQGAGNLAEAAAAYEDIAKDGGVDPILADYARLQIAMLKLDSAELYGPQESAHASCGGEKSVAFQCAGAVGSGCLQGRLECRGA